MEKVEINKEIREIAEKHDLDKEEATKIWIHRIIKKLKEENSYNL